MNVAELEQLARKIAPADFGGHPLYIVPQSELPAELQTSGDTYGYTAPALDAMLHDWLVAAGRWRGRGPAIVLNDEAMRAEAKHLATDEAGEVDADFSDTLYRSRLLPVFCHELAHVLSGPIDLRPIAERQAPKLQTILAAWTDEPPRAVAPFTGHGVDFIRTLLHVISRAYQAGVARLPARFLFDHARYGLSPLSHYETAAERETEGYRLTFAELRQCKMRPTLVKQWGADLVGWYGRQEESQAAADVLFAAMKPYVDPTTE